MPKTAKLYIHSTISLGLASLAACWLWHRQFSDPGRYAVYLLLAVVASTLKIRLPKIHGTISLNFLFILIGVAQLTLCETMILGCVATLAQSVWKTRTRPKPIQMLFNASAVMLSVAAAYPGSHLLAPGNNLPTLLASAACIYFLTNAALICLVLSLVEGRAFHNVWRQCYLWTFPYYLVGATIASLFCLSTRFAGWKHPLLVLPVMYLVYWYYRFYLAQRGQREQGGAV